MKKTIEKIKQSTHAEKNNKSTILEQLISNREKEVKEESMPRMDKVVTEQKNKFNKPCRFCNAPNWNLTHERPEFDGTCYH